MLWLYIFAVVLVAAFIHSLHEEIDELMRWNKSVDRRLTNIESELCHIKSNDCEDISVDRRLTNIESELRDIKSNDREDIID